MSIRQWIGVAAIVAVALVACNVTLGEQCWPNSAEGAASGEVIVPGAGVGATGSGDFDQPRGSGEPGGNPCNVASAPQQGECTVTWSAGSVQCQGATAGQDCTTTLLTTKAYSDLADAKAECERTTGIGNGSSAKSCECKWAKDVSPAADEYYWICIQECISRKGGKKAICTNAGETWEDELWTTYPRDSSAQTKWNIVFDKYLSKSYVQDTEKGNCKPNPKHPPFTPVP